MKKKWYKQNITVIISLLIFFPVGLFLMWRHTEWKKRNKIIITAIFALLLIIPSGTDTDTSSQNDTEVVAESEPQSNDIEVEEVAKTEESPEVIDTRDEDPIAAINGEIDGLGEPEPFQSQKVYNNDIKNECITYAKETIKENIRTPGTVKFPKTMIDADAYEVVTCESTTADMDGYIVTGYFDAQNAFGALVRSDFIVQLEMNDKQWRCVDIIINDR